MADIKFLYKFKPINTAIDLCRFEKTISENCIYMPNIEMLNDPLESMTYKISLGVAGGGYTSSCGHEHPIVSDAKNKYRILSLTEDIHSPLMWAHYGYNYTGICLIYSTNKTFSEAIKVNYTDQARYLDEGDFDELDDVACDSLKEKMMDWSYEKEWRLIQKEEPGYLYYGYEELIGVVVGRKMHQEIKNVINGWCIARETPCLCTDVLQYDSQIYFYPADMENPDFEFGYIRNTVKKEYPADMFKLFAYLNRKQMEKWKDIYTD